MVGGRRRRWPEAVIHVMVTKRQVWARCCARCRGYSGELDRQGPCPPGAYILMRDTGNTHIYTKTGKLSGVASILWGIKIG